MNCLLLEQGQDLIMVDCGVTFPNEDNGVDVLHPRFDYVLQRRDQLRGVFITHGHEDHIGALPYLLDQVDVPIWAPAHALGLIRHRLSEWQFELDSLRLHTTRVRERYQLGSFEVEPIRVTHSIADATALAIDTCAGKLLHTGDFKLDPHPADGEVTDEARLSELGDAGVRLLLSDSTSIDSQGWSASELVVGQELERVIAESPARAIVGMFASNVQRLQHLGDIARITKRRIVLLGRSVLNHVRVASEVGRLSWPSDLVVSPEAGQVLPRHRVLVIASGTQAEGPAALSRLAKGEHPRFKLEAGDRVLFSSRIIPGNDRAVVELYGALLKLGVEVCSRASHPKLHASGHAYRGEQERMIELVRPRAFMPLHGTVHHLYRHAQLARDMGVDDVLVMENGDIVTLGASQPLSKAGRAPSGRVPTMDGTAIDEDVLRERAQLGRKGILSVALATDGSGTRLLGRPVVAGYGVVGPFDQDVLAAAEDASQRVFEESIAAGEAGDGVQEAVRLAARRVVDAHVGQKPHVLVSLVRARAEGS